MVKQLASTSKRIIALDLIRGYLLLVILINHLNRFPGTFDLFSGRGELWTSAAEGFFLISGLLVGIVRGREIKEGKIARASLKMLSRAFYLYLWAIGLALIYTLVGQHYLHNPGLKPGITILSRHDWRSFSADLLSLRYIYGWADFLRYYAVYMLLAPLFLLALRQRLAIPALVAVVVAYGFKNHSQFLIWQLYFFAGAAIGYYWPQLTQLMAGLPSTRSLWLKRTLYAAAVLTLLADGLDILLWRRATRYHLLIHGRFDWISRGLINLHHVDGSWFNRFGNLNLPYGDGRLIISALWFSALYVLVRSNEARFKRYCGWLLMPIGCNPLLIYGFDSALIFAADLIWPQHGGLLSNSLINLGAIALSWLVASSKPYWSRRAQTIAAT